MQVFGPKDLNNAFAMWSSSACGHSFTPVSSDMQTLLLNECKPCRLGQQWSLFNWTPTWMEKCLHQQAPPTPYIPPPHLPLHLPLPPRGSPREGEAETRSCHVLIECEFNPRWAEGWPPIVCFWPGWSPNPPPQPSFPNSVCLTRLCFLFFFYRGKWENRVRR